MSGVIDVKSLVAEDGGYLRAMVQSIVEATFELEMTGALGAEEWECLITRPGCRCGYRVSSLLTRVATLELRVPQDRDGRFSTQEFERNQRQEKSREGDLAEMNVLEVSMRKVKSITPGSRSDLRDPGYNTAQSPDSVETLARLPAKSCSRTNGIGRASRVKIVALESELAHLFCLTEALRIFLQATRVPPIFSTSVMTRNIPIAYRRISLEAARGEPATNVGF